MSTLFLRHPEETDLALFAGGELGPLARWRIEGHLSGCAACRQAVGEFFELRSRAMDLAELPALDWSQIAARIHRRVEQERESSRSSFRGLTLWRPAWSLALALLVLLGSGAYVTYQRVLPGRAGSGAVQLDATADAVELRVGERQVLTLMNTAQNETQVHRRVSADAVSARYLDADTGNITVNNVYVQ
ncbi:MAG: zf-HC2 domain-containing protein [Acidobacteria bacterium]|nr:zf-HC2 domain-containing protein [Acidobacteriota bacterium]